MSAASDSGPEDVVRITGSGRIVSETYRPPSFWRGLGRRMARRLAPPFPPAQALRIALAAIVKGYVIIVVLGMCINAVADGLYAGVATLWRQWADHLLTASVTFIPICLNDAIKQRIPRHRRLSPAFYFFTVLCVTGFAARLGQGELDLVGPVFFALLPVALYLFFPNRSG